MKKKIITMIALAMAFTMMMGMNLNVLAVVDHEHEYTNWVEKDPSQHKSICAVDGCREESVEDHVWNSVWIPFDYLDEGDSYGCMRPCVVCHLAINNNIHEGNSCSYCGWEKKVPKKETSKPVEIDPTPAEEVRAEEEEQLQIEVIANNSVDVPSETVSALPAGTYNFSNFVTTKGFVAGLNKAVQTDAETKEVTVYTKKPFVFSNALIKAINEGGKDLVYMFSYKGHVYSITIPANVDANTLIEKGGFSGPLFIGLQLGTTKLIK